MSYNWRERLRLRQAKIIAKYNLEPNDLDWVEDHIEELCRVADLKCKAIDPNKAVDQVIDELDNEAFDKFTKGVIDEVKAWIDKNKKLEKKRKKRFEEESIETQIPLVYPDNTTPFARPAEKPEEIEAR